MLYSYDIPVAYSMVELARQSEVNKSQPLADFLCYWTAFNNIYTTIAEKNGYFARVITRRDGTIRTRPNGSVNIPEVEFDLNERGEISLAYKEFNDDLKDKLILHPNVKFFVYRIPRWRSREIIEDENGQRLNGVINIKYTSNEKTPVWSPIDIKVYELYIKEGDVSGERDSLSKQILFMIYTIRNNAFHGGKRADDAYDIRVINDALPLLKMIVEYFMELDNQ